MEQKRLARRRFLKTAVAGAAAGALAGCGGENQVGSQAPAVHTRPSITWRLASSFPRGLETIFGAADDLAERVAALTDNKFRIRVYPAGELVPAFEVLDAVQQGTIQGAHTASYYFKGKSPAVVFDTAVPFGFTARQQAAWLFYGGGLELMNEIYADFNAVNLPGGNTGIQMGGWFRKPIISKEDLNGLKMRIPGLGGEVMAQLGVNIQLLSGGEIYPALERGAIDATEWIGPYDDEKLGLHKIAGYYYYPGWWEPGPNLSYLFNRDAWNKLPQVYRSVLEVASRESYFNMLAKYDALNPKAFKRLQVAGVQMKPFSRDIMAAAEQAGKDIMNDFAAKDKTFARVYDQWRGFREQSNAWFSSAESYYSTYVFGK